MGDFKLLCPISLPILGVYITTENIYGLQPYALAGNIPRLVVGNWLIVRNGEVKMITEAELGRLYEVVRSY